MNIKQMDKDYVINSYGRFDLQIDHGKNATCFDEQGKQYIDMTSGIGVNALGFCDDEWAQAVAAQACKLQHTSNLYYTEPCAKLAKMIAQATGMARTFFANSGAEANEGMIKVARKYSSDKYGEGRSTILSLKNSFHGRTVTTLAATGQSHFHHHFFPFTEGFDFAIANDLDSVKAKMTDDVCGIILECIQGEGGVVPLDYDFVQGVQAFCKEKDVLLLVDEVQTGAGRTGTFLACQQFDVTPDVVTMAKGLGGGLPIGAVICAESTKTVLGGGDHGSTFGGNPISCAGGMVCVNRINDAAFLAEVVRKGEKIRAVLADVEEVSGVTGMGLMLGISLKTKVAGEVCKACIEQGLLVLTAKEKVRLLPPLTITDEELDTALAALCAVLNQ